MNSRGLPFSFDVGNWLHCRMPQSGWDHDGNSR